MKNFEFYILHIHELSSVPNAIDMTWDYC